MAKMYTLDEKLLAGVPEIRIGEKVYKVDDREKTVKKVMALYNNGEKKDIEKIDEMFKLAFEPAAAKEISEMEYAVGGISEAVRDSNIRHDGAGRYRAISRVMKSGTTSSMTVS